MVTRLAELENLEVELTEALRRNPRDFLVAMFRQRMGRIAQHQEPIQAILPEMFVNPELRERFFQLFVQPTAALLEQYVQARIELGQMRPIDVPLAVRSVQALFLGLLVLRVLGDEALQTRWNELPEVLAALIFDGLGPSDGG